MKKFSAAVSGLALLFYISHPIYSQSKKAIKLHDLAVEKLADWQNPFTRWNYLGEIKLDTFTIDTKKKNINFRFSTPLSYIPVRETLYQSSIESLQKSLGKDFKKYTLQITTDEQTLQALIPNYFRIEMPLDKKRNERSVGKRISVVSKPKSESPKFGLNNRNIAIWHSHGRYYEASLDRWEWQRARLFTTVEDVFPMTFVLPYLAPMLENSGANVFLARERDTQINEIIVDNDLSSEGSEILFQGIVPQTVFTTGFLKKDTLYDLQNPFLLGSYLRFSAEDNENHFMDYLPYFKVEGDYAVYVSYVQSNDNISEAQYTVSHTGGKTTFSVNQKIGGGTWIYLGTFHFNRGKNPDTGSVRLSSKSNEFGMITADAIRFGGGMGNIARKPKDAEITIRPKTSENARYLEGARYYLQYSGAPADLVYSLNDEKNDYNDDYQSRGEWVNYLMGTPNGPNENRNATGLNIPIDLALAFHTDAGVTASDSTIGTLAIYSSVRDEGVFPNDRSKMVNRDLSDIIQSEIVHDIRLQFNRGWTRRGLWNKQYSEAWRPNTPTMLLELLSHQNLADMQLGHDPAFKFVVSRAVYKGIVKFLAFYSDSEYVIQPLPVDHFAMERTGAKSIKLSWQPVLDTLEPTADPIKYKVYKRVGSDGFDNGQVVQENFFETELENYNEIYSFKVTALNEGGESFPSEILAAGFTNSSNVPVLIVNCFDRIAAPAIINAGEFAGVAHWQDEGVPDKYNIGYTGEQYDFDRNSPWLDDDSPGWGASYGNMEGTPIPGNSFDNAFIHGEAILNAGYSFLSLSDESFTDPKFDLTPYKILDLIYGEEKTTERLGKKIYQVLDTDIRQKLIEFTENEGNVFTSGAYIASDFIINKDTLAMNFAQNILHYKWRTNYAVKTGKVYTTDYAAPDFSGSWVFNTNFHPTVYKVEAPDAIEPAGAGAITAIRYGETNASAGTAFRGAYNTVVLGFPFETIIDQSERNALMKQVLDFFENEPFIKGAD